MPLAELAWEQDNNFWGNENEGEIMKTMLYAMRGLVVLSMLTLLACSGSGDKKSTASVDSLQTVNQPPADVVLKDKIKNYAEYTGGDLGEIESAYKAKYGDKAPASFDANFYGFVLDTDPAFKGMKSFLPVIFQEVIMRFMFARPRLADTAGPGDGDAVIGRERERIEAGNNMAEGITSTLRLLQSRLVTDAGFFDLKLQAARKDDFALPAKFFGGLPADVDVEFKDRAAAWLYAASVGFDGNWFSFFQFFDSNPAVEEGSRRSARAFGKLALISAEQNALFPDRPLREGGADAEEVPMLIER